MLIKVTHRFLVLLALISSLVACSSSPSKPDAELAACGSFPNCVNSQSGEGGQDVKPLAASAAQWRDLKQWIASQENWRVVVSEERFVQAVVVSPMMQFRDDVQLLYQPAAEMIQVRSSSRIGVSDLGANRDRVEELRRILLSF